MKYQIKYNENESHEINLRTLRMHFHDIDRNNKNLETKTHYMIAINLLLYSVISYFLGSAFEIISREGIIIVFLFTIFVTIDFVLIFKNLAPTSFQQIPYCSKDQNKEVYFYDFRWSNYKNSSITYEKAKCLNYILISLFLKIIMVFAIFLLTITVD